MVAFYFPEGRQIRLLEDYLKPLGLGDCTIMDGILQADLPLTDKQIEKIEAEGFVRADVFWYAMEPEPVSTDRSTVLDAFGRMPSTIIPPSKTEKRQLVVSFTDAVSDAGLATIKQMGYKIEKIAAMPALRS